MKRKISKIAIVIVSCLFVSCATGYYQTVSKVSDYTSAYVGKSHNQLVSVFGAPDRQTSDGAGGTILIYEKTTSTSNSREVAYDVNYYTKTYTPGVQTTTSTNTSFVHLFIDESGKCYKVNTNHTKQIYTELTDEQKKKANKPWRIMGWTFGSMAAFGAICGIIAACL